MFEKNSRILTKLGQPRIDEILNEQIYYAFSKQDRELKEYFGTASWKVDGPQEVIKITLNNHDYIICDQKQKLYIDYELYGLKEIEAKDVTLNDSLLTLTEDHYYQWINDGDDDERNLVFKGVRIATIEYLDAQDLEFYSLYVQLSNTCIVNNIVARC